MLKRTVRRTTAILAVVAAFTSIYAQFSWESDNNESWTSSSSNDYSSSYGSSEDSGSAQLDGASDTADAAATAAEESAPQKAAREPKAKKGGAKSSRASKSSGPSFSAAFEGPQKTCPVCVSKRLKGNLYVVSGGKKIHVCSAACIGRVKRNPSAFIAKLEKRGEQLAGM